MSGAASLLQYFFHHFRHNERTTAREERWAVVGGKGKPNMVGCLSGRGGWLILTRTTTKTPTECIFFFAMTARSTTTSFFEITANLWSDAFLVGRGDDFKDNDDSNHDHTDDDNGNNNVRERG